MITRAATTSATTALAGSRAYALAMSVGTVVDHTTGRTRFVTRAWASPIVNAAIFADSKHRRRPEEEASQP